MVTKIIKNFSDISSKFSRHIISKDVVKVKNEEAIRQAVKTLLLTRKGERPFHPEKGSPVYEFFFDTPTPALESVLEDQIRIYLETEEPRINVDFVDVQFLPANNEVRVTVRVIIVNISTPVEVDVLISRIR